MCQWRLSGPAPPNGTTMLVRLEKVHDANALDPCGPNLAIARSDRHGQGQASMDAARYGRDQQFDQFLGGRLPARLSTNLQQMPRHCVWSAVLSPEHHFR